MAQSRGRLGESEVWVQGSFKGTGGILSKSLNISVSLSGKAE